MTDLVATENRVTSFYELGATGKVAYATAIAKELANIIEKQKMYSVISGKKFVTCEGWTTTLALLGIVPREKSITRHEDGTYEAHVELVRFDSGQVVGGASAICGADEPTWMKRPDYARRSMACTRATGKAARLAYSWVIQLAGYQPTPAEEMPDEEMTEEERRAKPTPKQKTEEVYTGTQKQKEDLEAWLAKTKLPKDRWAEFEDKLMNQPKFYAKQLLTQFTSV